MKLRSCAASPGLSFEEAGALPRNFADARVFPERTTSIRLEVKGPVGDWNADFLFDYDVFPSFIMRYEAAWTREGRGMAAGDVILQRAVMPPVGFGLCMEFAVRVKAVFHEPDRRGFSYETLAGHAESGISEFLLEEREGELFFTIHTFSRPGHWTSRLVSRVFTLPYQAWCTRQALRHVRRRVREENGLEGGGDSAVPV